MSDPNEQPQDQTETQEQDEVNLQDAYKAEAGEPIEEKPHENAEKPAEKKEAYSALRRREERFRRQHERQQAQREKDLKAREEKLAADSREVERLRRLDGAKSLRERAELAGIDLEKLADEVLGRTPADDARDIVQAEIQREREAARRVEYERATGQAKAAKENRDREEKLYMREAADRPEVLEIVKSGRWDDDDVLRMSYRIGKQIMEETGKPPTNAEILDRVAEEAADLIAARAARSGKAPQAQATRPAARPGARTLTGNARPAARTDEDFDPSDPRSVSAYLARAARSPT